MTSKFKGNEKAYRIVLRCSEWAHGVHQVGPSCRNATQGHALMCRRELRIWHSQQFSPGFEHPPHSPRHVPLLSGSFLARPDLWAQQPVAQSWCHCRRARGLCVYKIISNDKSKFGDPLWGALPFRTIHWQAVVISSVRPEWYFSRQVKDIHVFSHN